MVIVLILEKLLMILIFSIIVVNIEKNLGHFDLIAQQGYNIIFLLGSLKHLTKVFLKTKECYLFINKIKTSLIFSSVVN